MIVDRPTDKFRNFWGERTFLNVVIEGQDKRIMFPNTDRRTVNRCWLQRCSDAESFHARIDDAVTASCLGPTVSRNRATAAMARSKPQAEPAL